jgi:anti-anti-sigma regulatory factor
MRKASPRREVRTAAEPAPAEPVQPVADLPPAKPKHEPVATTARAGLRLEAGCTLRDSVDMQFQLLAVDFGDADVVVDGSAVERIDTAGLQLLLSFAQHQARRGKTLRWSEVSPELMRSSKLLGLAAALGIGESNTGSDTRGN